MIPNVKYNVCPMQLVESSVIVLCYRTNLRLDDTITYFVPPAP